MIRKLGLCLVLLLLPEMITLAQNKLIDQKSGIYQETPGKQAHFLNIQEFRIDPQSVILSMPVKILRHLDKIYILDRKQSKIFVFNSDGAFLYAIGQPGQGPGDLEYPNDFAIKSNEIYIINSGIKRLEVFSLDGKFIKRIQLEVPSRYPFANPARVLVGNEDKIYVSYSLNDALIDSYLESGQYERALLKREKPIAVPGMNIGNSSHIQFVDGGKAILHFDYFTGLFTKVSLNGNILGTFSAYNELQKKAQDKVIIDLKKEYANPTRPGVRIEDFELWSNNPCVEETGDILALLLLRERGTSQRIFVFSADGLLKYVTPLDYFINKPIKSMFVLRSQYFFLTQENQIFMAERRRQ